MGSKRRHSPLVSVDRAARQRLLDVGAELDAVTERHLWKLSLLCQFINTHGLEALRKDTVVAPGVPIGTWAARCRLQYRRDKLVPWLADALDAIPGWSWEKKTHAEGSDANIERLIQYVTSPEAPISVDTLRDLGWWIHYRRQDHRMGKLDPKLKKQLERIEGWTWKQRR